MVNQAALQVPQDFEVYFQVGAFNQEPNHLKTVIAAVENDFAVY